MSITPGFAALINRLQGEDPCGCTGRPIDRKTAITAVGKDTVVVEVKDSSSIAKLEYTSKSRLLKTTYKSGGSYLDKDITQEEFEAICNPSERFDHSIGKAHHAIVKKRVMKAP